MPFTAYATVPETAADTAEVEVSETAPVPTVLPLASRTTPPAAVSWAARLGWLPGILREPFAVTLAAQVGTLPLTAAGFHVLSPVAPIANALVLPLLPAMVGIGLLIAPLAAIPDLGRVVAIPLDGLLAYLEQVAVFLAAVPLAAIPVPNFPAWVGGAYYSTMAGVIVAIRGAGTRRIVALALAAGVPLAIATGEVVAWRAQPPAAVLLDVGDGQALLLTGPTGRVLVDGGPSPARRSTTMEVRRRSRRARLAGHRWPNRLRWR